MHSSHCEDLCKVAMETEKITFLSEIAAASAKKKMKKKPINTKAVIRPWLFYCKYKCRKNIIFLTFRCLINFLIGNS